MKKILISILAILILAGCSTATEQDSSDEIHNVAATIFPVADIAANIGGDKVKVDTILAPGASPHTFNPAPSDINKIENAAVVFSIGHDLDSWIVEMSENFNAELNILTVDAGIDLLEFGEDKHNHDEHSDDDHEDDHSAEHDHDEHEEEDHDDDHGHNHEGTDPHYWLSASNGAIMAENIANTLIELDPANEDYYLSNLNAFKQEMLELDSEIKGVIANGVEKPEMIVFHDSWAYFADRYGLEVIATFEPSPGKEPTPKYLEDLYVEAEYHELTAVFSEPQLSSAALDPFVEDLGLSIFILDPLGGLENTSSYSDLLFYNAQTIAEAI